ncbi:large subunit ribosomal protein L32 [Streptosporangium becharense]|uniref:Large ribosomal subunit protein bL32 n=1 Tax=Streptosporangium becharense TaxID=1816182 RepID=A0A7W9IC38_9ACTN|nr:50S ribosomal protein L32 [Streptosporangium becharense]MBB2910769.1 large subunit ribosomal protein L32 [Streptosporangium becharense]MBB5817464.1 large subunit ribosomal protein L32 [Streptosporangium becharense]
MAVPKRKTSRSNTRHRRSQWKATAPDLVPITVNGRELLVPRRLVRAYRRGLVVPD